jgi:hypothetical protein
MQMTIKVRPVGPNEATSIRAETVKFFLSQLVVRMKAELDPASFLNIGGAEIEMFVAALLSGGLHPALTEWEDIKNYSGRPLPSMREQNARRLVILMCVALERAGLKKRAARKSAEGKLATAHVFDKPPSHRTIEYWQGERDPALTPQDELLAATGFTIAGGDPQKIALYFIGLAHLALNPTATAVRQGDESARDCAGYLGRFEAT